MRLRAHNIVLRVTAREKARAKAVAARRHLSVSKLLRLLVREEAARLQVRVRATFRRSSTESP